MGIGTVNPHSLITVRLLSREPRGGDADFPAGTVGSRSRLRERLFGPEKHYRAVYSEADFLPGLIVDRFGDLLVLQTSTAGMERLLPAHHRIADRSAESPSDHRG